jgi:drug/metabolite transporter (DMT)-like permease
MPLSHSRAVVALLGAAALLVGAAYAINCIIFVLATRLTTSANAIFIQSASPLFVLLLSPLLLGERARSSDLAFMLPIAVGLALVFLGNEERIATAPDPPRGNLVAAVSGVGFAFAVIGLHWLSRDAGSAAPITAVVAGNVMAW